MINTATMIIPMACLWFSLNVLGLDDPVADNLAGVAIGQLLGQAALVDLFREYVFQKPADMRPAGLHALGRGGADHRLVHRWPSSATRSRSRGRLTPTTSWWSPSMPVTKAPPRPSTVNALATSSGSPVAM